MKRSSISRKLWHIKLWEWHFAKCTAQWCRYGHVSRLNGTTASGATGLWLLATVLCLRVEKCIVTTIKTHTVAISKRPFNTTCMDWCSLDYRCTLSYRDLAGGGPWAQLTWGH